MPQPDQPKQQRSRFWLYLPFFGIAVAALVWTAFWFVAAQKVDRALEGWLQEQRGHGNIWTCPQRVLAGYPFRIELSCDHPTFAGTRDGQAMVANLGAIHAVAQVYDPGHVIAQIDSPLEISLPQTGESIKVAFANTLFSFHLASLTSGKIERADLSMQAVSASVNLLAQPPLTGAAGGIEAHLRRTKEVGETGMAYQLAVSLVALAVPALDTLSRQHEAADVSAQGVATLVPMRAVKNLAQFLELWRNAGGHFRLDRATFTKGPIEIDAQGDLALDAEHRMSGTLQTQMHGIENIAKRFGLPVAALSISGLLNGLLAPKESAATKAPQAPGTVDMPLTLRNGAVFVGPIRTPLHLAPLY